MIILSCTLVLLASEQVAGAAPTAVAVRDREESYHALSPALPGNNFSAIVRFVLKHGDRRTYCSGYNDNPHYRFADFDVYLNPSLHWKTYISNSFEEIVIASSDGYIDCFHLRNGRFRHTPYKNAQSSCENETIFLYEPHGHKTDGARMKQAEPLIATIFAEMTDLETGAKRHP